MSGCLGDAALSGDGRGGKDEWQMRRDHKTPCYTTRIEDVPRAKI